MKILQEIRSPNHFIVTPYSPGLQIDFSHQTPETDLDKLRTDFSSRLRRAESRSSSLELVEELLIPLGISERKGDFAASLLEFSGATDIVVALDTALNRFGLLESLKGAGSFVEKVETILRETGVLQKAENLPTRLYCHIPNERTTLPDDGTHFGFVMSGTDNYLELPDGYRYPLRAGKLHRGWIRRN